MVNLNLQWQYQQCWTVCLLFLCLNFWTPAAPHHELFSLKQSPVSIKYDSASFEWINSQSYKTESVKLKHKQIIFADREFWQSVCAPPLPRLLPSDGWCPIMNTPHPEACSEITNPQDSRDNKQMRGLGEANQTLNSIIQNLLRNICISESLWHLRKAFWLLFYIHPSSC